MVFLIVQPTWVFSTFYFLCNLLSFSQTCHVSQLPSTSWSTYFIFILSSNMETSNLLSMLSDHGLGPERKTFFRRPYLSKRNLFQRCEKCRQLSRWIKKGYYKQIIAMQFLVPLHRSLHCSSLSSLPPVAWPCFFLSQKVDCRWQR